MSSSPMLTPSILPSRSARLLDKVEHRCAITDEDRELVYRTRHSAYAQQNSKLPGNDGRVFDGSYDLSPNHYNVMTFVDGEFVSTIRIHVGSEDCQVLPSLALFGDVVSPFLHAGSVVIDPTRIVARSEYAQTIPELPYLTIRAAWLAAEHFHADMLTSMCIREHQGFYSRVFGFETLSAARPHPKMERAMVCMCLNYQANKENVEDRYPIFRSTAAERRALFAA